MNDVVLATLITGTVAVITVMVTGVVGPAVMAYQLNKSRRAEKQLDWKRQDEVAEKAAATAKKLLEQQEAATQALEASTRSATVARQQTNSQLIAIHGLVNSNLTTALQADLDSTRRELAALVEIMEMKREAGHTVSVDAKVVIEQAKARVIELEKIMVERRAQDDVAKAQIDRGDAHAMAADAAELAAPAAAEHAARRIVPPVVTEKVPPVVKEAVMEAFAENAAAEAAKKD